MSRSGRQGRAKRQDIDQRVPVMVFTLLGSGFILDTVRTHPGYALAECRRSDEFGVTTQYVFVLPQKDLPSASANAIARRARSRGAHMVIVGDQIPEGFSGTDWPTFQSQLGGPVKSWLPLEASFPAALHELGHNRPIEGIEGRPDELFEEYVARGACSTWLHSTLVSPLSRRASQALSRRRRS